MFGPRWMLSWLGRFHRDQRGRHSSHLVVVVVASALAAIVLLGPTQFGRRVLGWIMDQSSIFNGWD